MSSRFELRVYRGGRNCDDASDLAVRARLGYAPFFWSADLGFRCVRAKSVNSGRVFRGGSGSDDAVSCRAADRDHIDPESYGYSLGFRLVRREE